MRKKLTVLALAAGVLATALTGCAAEGSVAAGDEPSNGSTGGPSSENGTYSKPTHYGYDFNVQEFTYKLKDGREVTCIWADGGHSGGPSCDWDNVKPSDR